MSTVFHQHSSLFILSISVYCQEVFSVHCVCPVQVDHCIEKHMVPTQVFLDPDDIDLFCFHATLFHDF